MGQEDVSVKSMCAAGQDSGGGEGRGGEGADSEGINIKQAPQ